LGDHKVYTLRLPAALHIQLRHYCLDKGMSLNDLLVSVIEDFWSKESR